MRFNSLLAGLSRHLRLGLKSLKRSQTAALKLFLFLLLITYVYALIGTVAFNRVAKIFPINDRISFHTVWRSMILLYQICTSAGWDGVYKALIVEPSTIAILVALYLLSYLFISIFILINLTATVILNFYSQVCDIEDETTKLRKVDLDDFNDKWKAVAIREQPLFIRKSQLIDLLNRLAPTSSLRCNLSIDENNIKLLGIPVRNEQQLYRGDVLIALNKIRMRYSNNQK